MITSYAVLSAKKILQKRKHIHYEQILEQQNGLIQVQGQLET